MIIELLILTANSQKASKTMQITLNSKVGQWIADNAHRVDGRFVSGNLGRDGFIGERIHNIDAEWAGYGGRWYVCQMHCGPTDLICAKNLDEAFSVYVDQHCHDESDDMTFSNEDYGYFTDSGKWISEAQLAYVFINDASNYPNLTLNVERDEQA